MPELPEVQTVVNDLAEKITGDQLTGFWTGWPKAVSLKTKEKVAGLSKFERLILDQKILAVRRVGKNIVIDLTNGLSLLIHLRMTGQLLVQNHEAGIMNQEQKASKHVHHIFYLKQNGALFFHDVRKFGTITLLETAALENLPSIATLGTDPFAAAFTTSYLRKILKQKEKKTVKELLLDQSAISGIGNIYASEILFDAEIHPARKAGTLTPEEVELLHSSIKKILRKAVRMRGTSVSDYRDSEGRKGSFQNALRVYKKNGQPCRKCATMIEKSVISQRSTFYCPVCQK